MVGRESEGLGARIPKPSQWLKYREHFVRNYYQIAKREVVEAMTDGASSIVFYGWNLHDRKDKEMEDALERVADDLLTAGYRVDFGESGSNRQMFWCVDGQQGNEDYSSSRPTAFG